MIGDARQTLRLLARFDGVILGIVVSVGLAAGLAASVGAIVDGLLFRSLPFANADRLVRIYETNLAEGELQSDASPATFAAWRDTQTLDMVAGLGRTLYTLSGIGDATEVEASLISRDFMAISRPLAAGRWFEDDDFASAANAALGVARGPTTREEATVIISDALWQRRFRRSPDAVGALVQLDGHPARVIGIMPPGFGIDSALGRETDCWLPLVERQPSSRSSGLRYIAVVGRLAVGEDVQGAQAELETLAGRLEQSATTEGWGARVESLHESITADVRFPLMVLLAASGFVVVIACANVVNLLLVRGVRTSRDRALRRALGASRLALTRQALVQSSLPSLLGGGIGFALAKMLVPVLIAYAPLGVSNLESVRVDTRILAFSLLISLLAGAACGLTAKAMRGGRRADLGANPGSAAVSAHVRQRQFRQGLVVLGVALTFVLLVGASLLARSLRALQAVELGFVRGGILTFGIDPRIEHYLSPDIYGNFRRSVIQELEALSGVEAVGVGSVPLLGNIESDFVADVDETPIRATVDAASPGYFRALGIGARRGRVFTAEDGALGEPVALINRSFAEATWGTEEAIGRKLRPAGEPEAWMTVVGVVEDVRASGPEMGASHMVYVPYLQSRAVLSANYVVRVSGDPFDLIGDVRRVLRDIDPASPLVRVATMEERLDRIFAPRRFNLWLVELYAMAAFSVSGVGMFGLISESLASRRFEFGLRLALGARPRSVVLLMSRELLLVVSAGLAGGLAMVVVVGRVMETMLFGIETSDPVSYLLSIVLCLIAAVAASIVPMRSAWRTDPADVLRRV